MRTYDGGATAHTSVVGASGVRLALRCSGPPERPALVLLHGWAQSSGVWHRQFRGGLAERFRLIAVDLRGHGASGTPDDGYDSSRAWAEDVRAVLDLAGRPAVLVGWSYGGLVIMDYLREYGTVGLAGIALVGAITEIGRNRPGGAIGPLMRAALPGALSEDPAEAAAALLPFVTGMSVTGVTGTEAQAMLGTSLRVPPFVRAALFRRDVDSSGVLAAVDVPTVILHGRQDPVVAPAAAEYAAARIPAAEPHWLDGTGHLPFMERSAEFDGALADFAQRACTGVERTDR